MSDPTLPEGSSDKVGSRVLEPGYYYWIVKANEHEDPSPRVLIQSRQFGQRFGLSYIEDKIYKVIEFVEPGAIRTKIGWWRFPELERGFERVWNQYLVAKVAYEYG